MVYLIFMLSASHKPKTLVVVSSKRLAFAILVALKSFLAKKRRESDKKHQMEQRTLAVP